MPVGDTIRAEISGNVCSEISGYLRRNSFLNPLFNDGLEFLSRDIEVGRESRHNSSDHCKRS